MGTINYYISDDAVIFDCYFNQPLDRYTDIIKNYKKIIFSNYKDYKICLETNNEYIGKYNKHYKRSEFNQPIGGALNNLNNLTELTFGDGFNQPIDGALDNLNNLTKLTFGRSFNHPFSVLLGDLNNLTQLTFGEYFNHPVTGVLDNLKNLTQLTFGHSFNQPISVLLGDLNNLTMLTLGYCFNQELNIPLNIKILKLDCNNKIIDNLPNSIEELYLGEYFDSELNNLPNSIKIISFEKDSEYNRKLDNLPKSLSKLYLPEKYNKKIMNINEKCVISKKID